MMWDSHNFMQVLLLFLSCDASILLQQVDEGGAHQSRTDRLAEPRDILGSVDMLYAKDRWRLGDSVVRHFTLITYPVCLSETER
jgi:hypothetical protein